MEIITQAPNKDAIRSHLLYKGTGQGSSFDARPKLYTTKLRLPSEQERHSCSASRVSSSAHLLSPTLSSRYYVYFKKEKCSQAHNWLSPDEDRPSQFNMTRRMPSRPRTGSTARARRQAMRELSRAYMLDGDGSVCIDSKVTIRLRIE